MYIHIHTHMCRVLNSGRGRVYHGGGHNGHCRGHRGYHSREFFSNSHNLVYYHYKYKKVNFNDMKLVLTSFARFFVLSILLKG